MENEAFSWRKFLYGLVSPINFAKSVVFLVQASIVILIVLCVIFTGLWMKGKFFKKSQNGTVAVANMTGGCIHNSTDDLRKKFGLINVW